MEDIGISYSWSDARNMKVNRHSWYSWITGVCLKIVGYPLVNYSRAVLNFSYE